MAVHNPTIPAIERVMLLVMGFVIGLLFASGWFYETPSINCPQEDSCVVDYYDGAWHITPSGEY
jgi:hypothetical protein